MTKYFKRNFDLLAYSRLIQEIVFWYSIFIPFAYSINLSLEQISFSIIAVNLGVLIFEVPSGVMADRWSRKWTLALSTLTLIISSLIIGLSNGVAPYIIGSFFWGISFALQSGTSESLIYDLLKKEGRTNLYKKYLARFALFGTAGLLVGSVAGSVIADFISLRAAYLLTLVPSFISLVPLINMKEPKDHQKDQTFSSKAHYGVAFKHLIKSKKVVMVSLIMVLITAAVSFIFELNQVYYFAVGLPLAMYGLVNASLQFSIGAGSWLADKKSNKVGILFGSCLLVFLAAYVLFEVSILSAILLSVILLLFYYFTAILSHYLQDNIASEVRAAANSMVSTGGRIIFSFLILLFSIINTSKNEVNGFSILLVLTVVVCVLVYAVHKDLSRFDTKQRGLPPTGLV